MSHSTVFSHLWNCRSAYHRQNRLDIAAASFPLPSSGWVLAAICDAASPPALWLESEMREARNGPARLLGRAGSLDRIGPRFTLRPVTAHMCCSAPRKHKTDRLVERGENRNSSRFLAPLRLRRRPPPAARRSRRRRDGNQGGCGGSILPLPSISRLFPFGGGSTDGSASVAPSVCVGFDEAAGG